MASMEGKCGMRYCLMRMNDNKAAQRSSPRGTMQRLNATAFAANAVDAEDRSEMGEFSS